MSTPPRLADVIPAQCVTLPQAARWPKRHNAGSRARSAEDRDEGFLWPSLLSQRCRREWTLGDDMDEPKTAEPNQLEPHTPKH